MNSITEYFSEFFRLLRTIQLADIADLILVTILVYKGIQLIRTTSTARIGRTMRETMVPIGRIKSLRLSPSPAKKASIESIKARTESTALPPLKSLKESLRAGRSYAIIQ